MEILLVSKIGRIDSFLARGFIELDNGDPSEFFLPQIWGASGNSFFFKFIILIVFSNLSILLYFFIRKVREQSFQVC